MSLPSRTVLVTGGGSGIGRATAEAFVAAGDSVIILGRTKEKLQATADTLGTQCSWCQADVGTRSDVATAIDTVAADAGTIDVVVNNAGVGLSTTTDLPLAEAEERWNTVLSTNLTGSYLMTVAAAPHMPRGGRIVNISSIAARTGGSNPGSAAYAAAKAGVIGLTLGFARELSTDGITVNAIAPGFIADTEFSEEWPDERVQHIIDETPIGRAGTPTDIAAAIVYLASENASFITGEVLDINGGWNFGR